MTISELVELIANSSYSDADLSGLRDRALADEMKTESDVAARAAASEDLDRTYSL